MGGTFEGMVRCLRVAGLEEGVCLLGKEAMGKTGCLCLTRSKGWEGALLLSNVKKGTV